MVFKTDWEQEIWIDWVEAMLRSGNRSTLDAVVLADELILKLRERSGKVGMGEE